MAASSPNSTPRPWTASSPTWSWLRQPRGLPQGQSVFRLHRRPLANRIAKGSFTLEGKEYKLATTTVQRLARGVKGFDKVVWKPESFKGQQSAGVQLRYVQQGREEGYPGTLTTTVTCTLTDDNALQIDYEATTDKATRST